MVISSPEEYNMAEIEHDVGREAVTDPTVPKRICVEQVQNFMIEHPYKEMEPNSGPPEPFLGMEFQSIEDAFKYYNRYANLKGFSIRKNCVTKSRKDNTVIGQEFVCSKEGFRSKKKMKRDDRILVPPDVTREGCRAVLQVSMREEDKWVVSRFLPDHNHEFASPQSTKFLRTKRKKTEAQRNLIDVLDQSGVRPSRIMSVLANEAGGINNLCLTERDLQNYLSRKRQKHLERGDAQLMLNYFQEQQSKNPGFFYAIQMDVEGHLANCFWADARSRMSYNFFGDVVAFDPTYLTNKYKMPFVPFTGVNHHHQSILFGCALLWDETVESFVWLLGTWLKAMFGRPPITIITDQDAAITKAVAKVLPQSIHHFCMWHIEKKVLEYLSHVYHQHIEFKQQFYKCIHHTTTPDEFETTWVEILEKYNLHENDWLQRIYAIRRKWIPAYLRTTFCAGMSTTQRSESMNKYFKDYVNSSTPMSKFVVQYEKVLDARYDKEKEKSFKTKNSNPVLRTLYSMEEEAAKAYTRKIFRLFQDELVHSQQYVSEKIGLSGELKTYKVHELNKEKPVYIVELNVSSQKVVCSCHKFEFMGILCRHVLMIFIKKKIHSLPLHYILDRWTRNATKGEVKGISSVESEKNTARPHTLWSNNVMVRCLRLSERASRSKKHREWAIKGLQQLFDELDALPCEDANFDGINVLVSETNNEVRTTEQSQPCFQSHNITLLDPPHVATKGRPRSLRMKGGFEKSQKSNITCSSCKHKGHTKRTCPRLKQSSFSIQPINTSATVETCNFARTTETQLCPAWYEGPENYIPNGACLSKFTDLIAAASQQQLFSQLAPLEPQRENK